MIDIECTRFVFKCQYDLIFAGCGARSFRRRMHSETKVPDIMGTSAGARAFFFYRVLFGGPLALSPTALLKVSDEGFRFFLEPGGEKGILMNPARPPAGTEYPLAKNAKSAKKASIKKTLQPWRSLRLCERHNFYVRKRLSTAAEIIGREFPVVTT